jgi:surface protein
MSQMFENSSFNQPLDGWDVGKVTNMSGMFASKTQTTRTNFNNLLGDWTVTKVTDMSFMFQGCLTFNQLLEKWNVSNVKNMSHMFHDALSFNMPLDKWDVTNVKNMSSMFEGALSFNQSLENWNISKDANTKDLFKTTNIEEKNKPASLIPFFIGATIKENSACSICFVEMIKTDKNIVTPFCCKVHNFHKVCLTEWIDKGDNKTCPMCRCPSKASKGGWEFETKKKLHPKKSFQKKKKQKQKNERQIDKKKMKKRNCFKNKTKILSF